MSTAHVIITLSHLFHTEPTTFVAKAFILEWPFHFTRFHGQMECAQHFKIDVESKKKSKNQRP